MILLRRTARGRPTTPSVSRRLQPGEPGEFSCTHLSGLRTTTRRLQVRACAELVLGNSSAALQDVLLTLRLGNSIQTELFLDLPFSSGSPSSRKPCSRSGKDWRIIAGLENNWPSCNRSWKTALPPRTRPRHGQRARGSPAHRRSPGRAQAKLGDLGNVPGCPRGRIDSGFSERPRPGVGLTGRNSNYSRLLDRQLDGAFDSGRNRV